MCEGSPLWTSTQAAQATRGDATRDWTAQGVSINTRTLQPGDLFIALHGPHTDGHDFVADAFEKGAVAACVSHRPPVLDADAPLLVVADTQAALEDLARAARARLKGRVIALSGSLGKTGTKEALKRVLAAQGRTHASAGNLNNHWGLPLSLARAPADSDFTVLEMGMNHAGELTPLSRMARPHVCLITTVQPAHSEFFASLDEIADAKAEIFQGAQPGWTAVLNADIAQCARLRKAAEAADAQTILTFGESIGADFRVIAFEAHADGSLVSALTPQGAVTYWIGAAGRHWILNSLGVLATVHAVGGNVREAAAGLAEVTPPIGRGAKSTIAIAGGAFTLIDETYNASPVAMRAALDVLGAQPLGNAGRRIAVLGDMLELGEDSAAAHAALVDALVENAVDVVFLSGVAMEHLWNALPKPLRGAYGETSVQLTDALQDAIAVDDVVMIKGSAGARMGVLVERLAAMRDEKMGGT